jgi:hypothetical protein
MSAENTRRFQLALSICRSPAISGRITSGVKTVISARITP